VSKARLYVDLNELVTDNIVLLSKDDSKGTIITFYEGMPVSIYSEDISDNGQVDNLVAEGVAIKKDLSSYPNWQHVKWCCQIDSNGIIHDSDLR